MPETRRLRSLADLPKDIAQPAFVKWDAAGAALSTVGTVTRPLMEWLGGKFDDLVRERIARERVTVHYSGSRCEVHVDGKVRFEFKFKVTM